MVEVQREKPDRKQWRSENQIQKQERVLGRDTTVQTQDQKQKRDIGLVESGNMKVNEVTGITEEQFEQLAEKKDACYHKVKARYKVWPSAYASGALVQCRKKGAANWGNKSKK